jgi:hypothetical protein
VKFVIILNRDHKLRFRQAIVRTARLLAVIAIAVLSLVAGDLCSDVPIGIQHFVAI